MNISSRPFGNNEAQTQAANQDEKIVLHHELKWYRRINAAALCTHRTLPSIIFARSAKESRSGNYTRMLCGRHQAWIILISESLDHQIANRSPCDTALAFHLPDVRNVMSARRPLWKHVQDISRWVNRLFDTLVAGPEESIACSISASHLEEREDLTLKPKVPFATGQFMSKYKISRSKH